MFHFIEKLANRLAQIYYATPALFRVIYWVLPLLYFISPFDFLPDLFPFLGRIDDILLVLFAFWALDRSKAFKNFFQDARRGTQSGSTRDTQNAPAAPHQVLGVSRNANQAEIKKAYRKLISRYHPDKFSHLGPEFEATARRRTETIIGAYEQLKNGS